MIGPCGLHSSVTGMPRMRAISELVGPGMRSSLRAGARLGGPCLTTTYHMAEIPSIFSDWLAAALPPLTWSLLIGARAGIIILAHAVEFCRAK